MNCICAIDLDTAIPCYLVSAIKRITRVYDAHELFCEMKEIVTRPKIYKIWKKIEQFTVPKFIHGYTVNQPIAEEFDEMYGAKYEVIRSMTILKRLPVPAREQRFLLYQGSVNEGRSFETLIPAMLHVNCNLVICGDGNFMKQCRLLVEKFNLQEKVVFKGKLSPAQLNDYTQRASIGITLFENTGLSNYLSLANRFFDYMHAAVPQVCSAYPAYREINNLYEVAVLVDDLSPENIAMNCNRLLDDTTLYNNLLVNCLKAREHYNWQNEELKLINFYNRISM